MTNYTNDIETIFEPKDIGYILECIGDIDTVVKQGRGKASKEVMYNVPCSFDIEAYSWEEEDRKYATMYCWQFGINGYCVLGRTWRQLVLMLGKIADVLNTKEKTLVCYVHNLGYEFQWMKQWLNFEDVFFTSSTSAIKAVTKNGIEFRCSLALSGKKLEKVGEGLMKYKVSKKVGDLDYNKARHSKTALTEKEVGYCINDIKVVMSYIQEKIEHDGDISKIPLTKTSYIRKMFRDRCFGKGNDRQKYSKFIKRIMITQEVYDMAKTCPGGGYVHCSPYFSGLRLKNVGSNDRSSAHPASACSYPLFPMTSPRKREDPDKKKFNEYIRYYACLFTADFDKLRLKDGVFVAPMSSSVCIEKDGIVEDNGRIVSAKRAKLNMIDQDWLTFSAFYDWDDVKITNMYTFERDYLPKPIIEVFLDLYKQKTEYKNKKGYELEYRLAKENINSGYGGLITAIEKGYDSLEQYNNSWNRWGSYLWGVWIAGISRRVLLDVILELGEDFVYCDTDCAKYVNYEEHEWLFETLNEENARRFDKALEHYGIDKERSRPKDSKGVRRQMGDWEFEGVYEDFKAIRAKCYIGKYVGKDITLTLSGVRKDKGIEYLKSLGDPFDEFNEEMYFPAEHTGKLTHTYVDDEFKTKLKDYNGKECTVHEKTYIHMKDAPYDMSIEADVIRFMQFIIGGQIQR